MVPAASDKVPRASPYSGYPIEYALFRLQDCHLVAFNFPVIFSYNASFFLRYLGSYNPNTNVGLGSFLFARHY